ncbi:FAD-binding protein, partial [Salmonella enterica subsp. enterica serovar Enteritidis]|nr:FAD-binding protein [Salmonella enterica subsp. enterica serovar Enteritidis]
HGVPVTPRAGGTGRTGGAVPVAGGIVLATHTMAKLLDVDRHDLLAVVQPGLVTADLHDAVEAEGLFYPPDPNSLKTCMIGGNVAENAGGPRAFKYGV